MESREALRICSQALPGRDTGRTDLGGMKPPHSPVREQNPKGSAPSATWRMWGSGQSPENGSRD